MQTNGGNSFSISLVVFIIFNSVIHTVILFWMNQWANSKDYRDHMYMLIYVILTFLAGFGGVAFVHYIYTRTHYRDLPARMIESLLLSPL
jgi:ABC-type polysaccharide/polyol phosphate export permease